MRTSAMTTWEFKENVRALEPLFEKASRLIGTRVVCRLCDERWNPDPAGDNCDVACEVPDVVGDYMEHLPHSKWDGFGKGLRKMTAAVDESRQRLAGMGLDFKKPVNWRDECSVACVSGIGRPDAYDEMLLAAFRMLYEAKALRSAEESVLMKRMTNKRK